MVSINAESLNSVMEFASFASTELVLFVMAAVVYWLFVRGPSAPSKQQKCKKVGSVGRSKSASAKGVPQGTSTPCRKQANAEQVPVTPQTPVRPFVDLQQTAAKIKALAHDGDLDEAAAVLRLAHEGGAAPNAVLHNCFLDACVQNSDIDRAMAQFAEMKRLDLVDVVSYNTVLKSHLRRDQVAEAQHLLREMAARGLKASQVTYHELLNASVTAGDKHSIWRIVDEMRKADVAVSSITISILLKSLTERSSAADVQRTMELLDTLAEPMDDVLFSSAIEASIRIKQLTMLYELIRRYRACGDSITLSSPTYGSMIKAFGQAGDTSQVSELWYEMEARGVMPSEVTVGCMVEALVVNGQVENACELVRKLKDGSKQGCLNTVIYSTLLKGFVYSKEIEKAFAVYEEMRQQGVQCNLITYNTLLDGCAKNFAMGRVPALLEDMRQMEAEPDLITYSTLIKGYCLEGNMDQAFRMLEDMKSTGELRPDEIMYNSVLDGCAKQQRVEEALSVLEEMQEAGITPSNYTLSILVKVLGRTKRLSQSFKIVDDLSSRHGLRPNVQVYTCLIQSCFMNRKLERALEVHDTMITKGCMPDERFYVALVRGCLQLNAPQKAVDVVRAAFRMEGGSLSVPNTTRRPAGVDTDTVQQVCDMLRRGGSSDRAAAATLVADLERVRGVRVGTRATGAAPWHK
eukprot:gnl/TRDRNA2_/TRDRNA2_178124_c0_seq1.p1 gnl/TRDRNA2_/TRDRNA2_178124_c0~~gnl/TRDRNA2_/TRDRNA2_178124_c0_seq1.p1  ORF type:complete len:689 (+),score=147.56 gnl/TRDRNA2_/TRDRNA2_178124_c0_seq1:108-2174(+)